MEGEENDSCISAMVRGGAGFLLVLGSSEGHQSDGRTPVATTSWHQPSFPVPPQVYLIREECTLSYPST